MVVVELPDLGIAIRTYLRESTVLADASHLNVVGSANKIFVGWPRDKNNKINVPVFTDIIVIMTGRGGRGDIGLGQQEERVDILCYGQDESKCYKIWRALDFYFVPVGTRRKTYFTRNSCQVNWVQREGGPLRLVDPDAADWPYTMASYIFNYNGQMLE